MEPFPPVEEEDAPSSPTLPTKPLSKPPTNPPTRTNNPPRQSNASSSSTTSRRLRSASLKFLESNPPTGMWMATGDIVSRAPTLSEIRSGCFSHDGWTEEGQLERRGSTAQDIQRRKLSRANTFAARAAAATISVPATTPEEVCAEVRRSTTDPQFNKKILENEAKRQDAAATTARKAKEYEKTTTKEASESAFPQVKHAAAIPVPDETGTYPNGYRFPPKHTWKQSTVIGLKAFAHFAITPFGFLVTIYGLNVVAWGAMIFFLLLNAAPAMCNPSCTASNSLRQIWIEIDAQILNALFCVTGFGLIPWRFRDFYYLFRWRLMDSHAALRKLAGVHRAWFRLADSDKLDDTIGPPPVYPPESTIQGQMSSFTDAELEQLLSNPALPLPPSSIPPAPLTGARAPPTKPWLLDVVVWMYVINTALQACLAGIMWGMNRFTRPSWAVGFLIAAGCVTGMVAGFIAFWEGRRVKRIEGIPVEEEPKDTDLEDGRGEATTDPIEKRRLAKRKTRTKSWREGGKWYRRI
ncbi:hypothetical protein AJ79_01169 [Helicocarpus griseus UAMH5409]|uniref:Uncharacterized protein n=1 Tax=Helicocarpus griseus UAMH5409 TaxID=1447875 RepID=A0A2B7Y6Z5_9EURO|nr:hypothetical protein AJ79_01169 [Helicocarpus griseus UAMH5409]